MEKLTRLFGRSIRFAYHCFDRIVIRGYLSTLSRPENIVYFFRTIKQAECISKETLRQRTDQYLSWVNAYTQNKECVAKPHPVFEGLQAPGILDWDYYDRVISRRIYEGDTADEVIAAAFAVGYPCSGGYASGVMVGAHEFGKGRFLLSTLNILDNIDRHPAADRLLLNFIRFAQCGANMPLTRPPSGPSHQNGRSTSSG